MHQGPSSPSQSSSSTPVMSEPTSSLTISATSSTSSSTTACIPSPEPFSLSQHAPSRTAYTAMTRLPSVATLEQLEELAPFISLKIKECLSNIYFHVVHRDGDSLAVFFHHLAATVMYENYSTELINNANHAVKAAGIVNMINKTLSEIQSSKNNSNTHANQKEILSSFETMIIMHRNILIEALKGASAEVKAHIKAHQNLDVDASQITPLSPQKHDIIIRQFPATPSPQKGKGTPKKLTDQDRVSIGKLKPVRPLVFESSSEEEDSSSNQSPGSLDSDSSDSEDSLDAFLMGQANKRFTPYFGAMNLSSSHVSVSVTFSGSDSDSDSAPNSDIESDNPSSPVKERTLTKK